MKLKTVVLVTHQVNMTAPHADRIVVMGMDGTITEQGTYKVRGVCALMDENGLHVE